MATDEDLYARIKQLVEEEHELDRGAGGDRRHERRVELETQLDQCWALLRQRQARRSAGEDPNDAQLRPPGEVESYLQ